MQKESEGVQTKVEFEPFLKTKTISIEAQLQDEEAKEIIKTEIQNVVPSEKQEPAAELSFDNNSAIAEMHTEQPTETKENELPPSESAVPTIKVFQNIADDQSNLLMKTVEEVIRFKEAEIEQKHLEVELLKNLLSAVNSLQEREGILTAELNQAHNQAANLQSANESLHKKLNQSLQAQRAATEILKTLEEKSFQLEEDLKGEKAARELQKKQYGERLERESREGVNDFKGKISRRLNQVFAKKRSIKNQPFDAKLAESLFHYFQEIEDIFNEMDISIQ